MGAETILRLIFFAFFWKNCDKTFDKRIVIVYND